MVRGGVPRDPFGIARTTKSTQTERETMRIKTIPAKIAAVIAALALTATIMAPAASAAPTPPPAQGTHVALGTPVALAVVASNLQLFPGILNPS
jgi:hypothetical protein